jgi:hypothetical protein
MAFRPASFPYLPFFTPFKERAPAIYFLGILIGFPVMLGNQGLKPANKVKSFQSELVQQLP